MTSLPRIRVLPEDFEVEEISLEEPQGDGQHLWLWIEKRLRNTDQVLDDLAQGLGIESRQVGYAGRKDHRAVTRQWVSVPAHLESRLATLELPQTEILRAVRHPHRLRLGELSGNRFQLRVRQVDTASMAALPKCIETLRRRGMVNRFGRQRFGNDGRNAERGAEMLRRGRMHGPRRKAKLMLSALQSEVFNRVLDDRADAYDQLKVGDLAFVHASGELLQVNETTSLEERCLRCEVSATGPMFGSKMRWPRGEVILAEEKVMEDLDLPPLRRLDLPRGFKLYGDRRPLRVPLHEMDWHDGNPEEGTHEDGSLELRFVLPPGSYATVLLEELFPAGYEEGPEDPAETSS